jgi:PAS domain S-box-containing protein
MVRLPMRFFHSAEFKEIFEQMPSPVCVVDQDGHFIHVNEAFASFIGIDKSLILDSKWEDFTEVPIKTWLDHPSAMSMEQKWFLPSDRTVNSTIAIKRLQESKNGKFQWIVSVHPVDTGSKADNAFLRSVLSELPVSVLITDGNGSIAEINEAYALLHGFDSIESCKKALENGFNPLSEDGMEQIAHDVSTTVLTDKKAKTFNYVNVDVHGKRIPLIGIAKPVEHDGRTWMIIAQMDATAIKKKEDELKERENYWRAIFDLSATGFVVMDENAKVVDMNESFATTHGFASKSAMLEKIGDGPAVNVTIAPEYREKAMEFIKNAIAKDQKIVDESENIKVDGTSFPVLDMITYTMINGKRYCIVAQTDLTEIKAKEQTIVAERNFWQTLFD